MNQDNTFPKNEAQQSLEIPEGLQQWIIRQEAQLHAKSQLIDNMTYQIRTLSNAVIGFSDLLLSEELEKDLQDYVQEINRAGNGLSALVSEVLDWAQLLSGKLTIDKNRCSLFAILGEVEKVLSATTANKSLEYAIVIDPELPSNIITDAGRLLKCLVNLTVSAVKHTSEGSVQIHVKKDYQDGQAWIRFEIIDTGTGIEPEKLRRVFEPTIYRIEMDQEMLSQLNSGLTVTAGLPLTKQLCELLGGRLEGTSQVHIGSHFILQIPAGLDAGAEVPFGASTHEEAPETPACPDAAHEKSVLLVEDQESNRTVLTLMLESIGACADAASGGRDAIAMAGQKPYDLILMDLKMPGMDGYETTMRLREQGFENPIVALSAKVMDEDEYKRISTLFDGFLAKPVDHTKLSDLFRTVFNIPSGSPEQAATDSGASAATGADADEETFTFEYRQ